jgi:hypothetical protein
LAPYEYEKIIVVSVQKIVSLLSPNYDHCGRRRGRGEGRKPKKERE